MKSWLIGKDSDAGRDWGQEEKEMTEDEMAGWHHWLDGHESQWTPGVGDGQRGLACCDSWGRKESDTTERLNWTELSCIFSDFSKDESRKIKKTDFRPEERDVLVAQMVKNLSAMRETWVWSLGWEDPLEQEMATHSSILAWRILRTEEPSRLQFSPWGHKALDTTDWPTLPLSFSRDALVIWRQKILDLWLVESEKHFPRLSEHFSPPLINIQLHLWK